MKKVDTSDPGKVAEVFAHASILLAMDRRARDEAHKCRCETCATVYGAPICGTCSKNPAINNMWTELPERLRAAIEAGEGKG